MRGHHHQVSFEFHLGFDHGLCRLPYANNDLVRYFWLEPFAGNSAETVSRDLLQFGFQLRPFPRNDRQQIYDRIILPGEFSSEFNGRN